MASAQNFGKRGLCHPIVNSTQINVVATFSGACKTSPRLLKELPKADIQTPHTLKGQTALLLKPDDGCDQWDFDIDNGPRSNEFIRWDSQKRMNSLLRGSPASNHTPHP